MNRQYRWVSVGVGLLVLIGLAARHSDAEEGSSADVGFTNLITPNTLDGWKLGTEDLTGKTTTADGRFKLDGETIVIQGAEKIEDLYTVREFNTDFVLRLEFRADPKANSGLYIRGKQLQVRDYATIGPYKDLKDFHEGGWNAIEVKVTKAPTEGGSVAECRCNGELLEQALEIPVTGGIGLQSETGKFEYRRIRIKTGDEGDAVNTATALNLQLRSRVPGPKGTEAFRIVEQAATWDPAHSAIIVCDMWDLHHCLNATRRGGELAPRMDKVLKNARARGMLVIHSPSECMDPYKDHPARKRAQNTPKAANLPQEIGAWCYKIPSEEQGTYPIDQTDGGEDDDLAEHQIWATRLKALGRNPKAPWKSETARLSIDPDVDYISDNGEEIWSVLEDRKIDNVILLGVHLNMCVLGRPFGLRQLAKNGKNVVLMRDMTDTMYNPLRAPYVSHFSGTDLIVEHVEKFVAPSITSDQLVGGEPFQFSGDRRPHVVVLMADDEYKSERTLPVFASQHLLKNYRVTLLFNSDDDPNSIAGLEALYDADVLLVSTRRKILTKVQLAKLRAYVASGRPVIGIRTASHAFSPRGNTPVADDRDSWPTFDGDVLGGSYVGHHEPVGPVAITVEPGKESHLILQGVDVTKLKGVGTLYKVLPLASSATPLLSGSIPDQPSQPIAWTNLSFASGRVFYTSLGHPDDFAQAEFQKLLRNAIDWAAHQEAASSVQ